MIPRLKTIYEKDIINKLMTKLEVKNRHEVPRIEKIIFFNFFTILSSNEFS